MTDHSEPPPAPNPSPSKCIVFGCTNHKDIGGFGGFFGDICSPCFNIITTGKIRPTNSFIGDLNAALDRRIDQVGELKIEVLELKEALEDEAECDAEAERRYGLPKGSVQADRDSKAVWTPVEPNKSDLTKIRIDAQHRRANEILALICDIESAALAESGSTGVLGTPVIDPSDALIAVAVLAKTARLALYGAL